MTTDLDYIPGTSSIPEGCVGISPSRLSVFFSAPWQWAASELKGERSFTGDTATVLGTIVHYIAEEFGKKSTNKNRRTEIYKYLYSQLNNDALWERDKDKEDFEKETFLRESAVCPTVDFNVVLDKWELMAQKLVDYLKHMSSKITHAEDLINTPITSHVYACGSCDAVFNDNEIVDYKTCKSASDSIPFNYRLQLLTYAYIYRQRGLPISRISIIWITKPENNRIGKTGNRLADIPCNVTKVTEEIGESDFLYIENILKLVAESVEFLEDNPDKSYIVWKDYRLK